MNDSPYLVKAFRVDSNRLTNPERTLWQFGTQFYVCSRIAPSWYVPDGEFMVFRSNALGEVSDYLHVWEDDDATKTHSQVFREFVEDYVASVRNAIDRGVSFGPDAPCDTSSS